MKLKGIELRNFRSIGEAPVILSPIKKCNLVIGQNNSGKSNVLRAIQKISELIHEKQSKPSLVNLDLHNRLEGIPFRGVVA